MNTNPVNNVNSSAISAPVGAQTPPIPVLTLVPYRETAEFTSFFRAPSGHRVIITTTFFPEVTRLNIRVENDYGYLNACSVSFSGDNHEEDYEEFYEQYMDSFALCYICEHFDELCIPHEGKK